MTRNNIRRLRQARGLTASDLADKAGLWPSQVYYYERGQMLPSVEKAFRLARALDCDIDDLYTFAPKPYRRTVA